VKYNNIIKRDLICKTMSVREVVGTGRIVSVDGKRVYDGTLPFDDGRRVLVVDRQDFSQMLGREMGMLLSHPVEMPEAFYDNSGKHSPELPDEIISAISCSPSRLFLDRNFYSLRPNQYICARWVSVELSSKEEA